MNNTGFERINADIIEHEGFTYVEFNGEFFKGCKRCGGTGHYSFDGYSSDCYACGNSSEKLGEHLGNDRKVAEKWCHERAVRRAQRERKAQAKAQAAQDARDARVAALTATDPEVVALLKKTDDAEAEAYATGDYRAVERTNGFLRDMAGKLFNAAESGLTDNMVAALRKFVASEAEKAAKAAAHPAPSGRVVVTGEIASAKVKESDYGVAYKILVKDDAGFKVWVSLPKAQADQAREAWAEVHPELYTYGPDCWFLGTDGTDETGVVGLRITFTATLEPSQDDVAFAFGSRPSKGSWI